jgi:diadenylate cyclase
MWETLATLVETYGRQAVEVILAAVIFYYILLSVRGTKMAVLLTGLIVLGIIYGGANALRLVVISEMLEKLLLIVPFALIIIFVPEIRHFLERAGRTSRMLSFFSPLQESPAEGVTEERVFDAILGAVKDLAQRFHGALIAIELEPIDKDLIVTGTWLEAVVSETSLRSIFEPHNPLHDGAVIVRDDRILYAGCFLPLSVRDDLDRDLGTRHRAAIGITEKVDCIVIVVSEERGKVSIAYGGRLARDMTSRQFEEQLRALYFANPNFSTALSHVRI